MKTTKITLQAEIYDDPEFCNSSSINACRYLDHENALCTLYPSQIFDDVYGEIPNGLETYFNGVNNPICKCDQCKAAWKASQWIDKCEDAIRRGFFLLAIKIHRDNTGSTIKESRAAMEKLRSEMITADRSQND